MKKLSHLISLVIETDEFALQVNLIHRDAPTGRGMLADTGLCHGAPHHAGSLTVVVVETALLAARGVAAAGCSSGGLEQAAGVGVA